LHLAHAPIYGFGVGPSGLNHLTRLARLCRIPKLLNRLEFHSLLDVGGGEGFNAHQISMLFGAKVACADISLAACRHSRDLFGIPSYALAADRRLPFKDNSFDVVLCSEVIEHVNDPVQAIGELLRVSSKTVIITTQEYVSNRFERWLVVSQIDLTQFQNEKNFFIPDDFRRLLGPSVVLTEQMNVAGFVWNREESLLSKQQARQIILNLTERDGFGYGSFGIMASYVKHPSMYREPLFPDPHFVDHLLNYPGVQHSGMHATVCGSQNEYPSSESFLCPACRSEVALDFSGTSVRCQEGHLFPIVDGVPDFAESQRTLSKLELNRVFEPGAISSVLRLRKFYTQRSSGSRILAASLAPVVIPVIHFSAHPADCSRRRLGRFDKRFSDLRGLPVVRNSRDGFYEGYHESRS
jgi:SAM-dependent methyltransferase